MQFDKISFEEYCFESFVLLQKILILSVVVGACIAATVAVVKPEAKLPAVSIASEELKTAESNGRQFGGGMLVFALIWWTISWEHRVFISGFGIGVPYFGLGDY